MYIMKLFSSYQAKLLVGMVISIIILILVSSFFFNIGSRLTSKYTPLIDATMEIRLESTSSHLMLEEMLHGDRNADISPIVEKIKNSIWYAKAMLHGGRNHEGVFLPIDNKEMEVNLRKIIVDLESLIQLTEKRYVDFQNNELENTTKTYEKYHSQFDEFTMLSEIIETELQQTVTKELKNYETTYYIVLIIFIVMIIAVTLLLYKYEREKISHVLSLSKQKELYELVFKNTSSSVLILDLDSNTFIDCNDFAVEALGYDSKKDVLHLSPAQISPEYQPDGQRSNEKSYEMNSTAVLNGAHNFVWKHITKTGKEFWVEVVLTPMILEDKKVLYVVWKDIEDKIRAEEELEKKKALLVQQSRFASMGEMIGNIAHQWRQPLNTLGLLTQKMKLYHDRGMLDTEKLNESVDKSMELIQGMSSTIDDFRDFFNQSKTEEKFLVEDAIEKAYSIVGPSFTSHQIKYTLKVDTPGLSMVGLSNEFSQVIINLLNNAKDALMQSSKVSGEITVMVQEENGKVCVDVCDNAGGIPESVLPKIFDPYFTTKEEGKGTGIGLYMSKMIIEEHMHGRLNAANVDEGVCFTIKI